MEILNFAGSRLSASRTAFNSVPPTPSVSMK
jgi:hypothetical protein